MKKCTFSSQILAGEFGILRKNFVKSTFFCYSAKLIHKSKRKRRRTGDNNEEPVESDGALEGNFT